METYVHDTFQPYLTDSGYVKAAGWLPQRRALGTPIIFYHTCFAW